MLAGQLPLLGPSSKRNHGTTSGAKQETSGGEGYFCCSRATRTMVALARLPDLNAAEERANA